MHARKIKKQIRIRTRRTLSCRAATLPSENPGQPAVFFERIETWTAQLTSHINDFFISYNPFARQIPVNNEKKTEFWRAGERMLLRAGYEAVPRASPPGSSHLGKTPLPAYCRHDAK